jgi:hypothetical protein
MPTWSHEYRLTRTASKRRTRPRHNVDASPKRNDGPQRRALPTSRTSACAAGSVGGRSRQRELVAPKAPRERRCEGRDSTAWATVSISTVRGGREQGRGDGSGEERRCGRGGWIDAPFGKPLVDQSPGGGGGGTRKRRLSRREQRRRKQTHEVRGIGRESARVAPPRRCGIARRARDLRGCRSCRPANARRPIACLGLLEGRAADGPTTLAHQRW